MSLAPYSMTMLFGFKLLTSFICLRACNTCSPFMARTLAASRILASLRYSVIESPKNTTSSNLLLALLISNFPSCVSLLTLFISLSTSLMFCFSSFVKKFLVQLILSESVFSEPAANT